MKHQTNIFGLLAISLLTGQANALSLNLIDGSVGAASTGNTLTTAPIFVPSFGDRVEANPEFSIEGSTFFQIGGR